MPRRARDNHGDLKSRRGEYPAASALADAYDGFDVMDFERPSLIAKHRGRKGKINVNTSDSDFAEAMQTTWSNDRIKKKEIKQKREELRAQGLLGKNKGKLNLNAKYKEGMGLRAVNEEIRTFLIGENTTYVCPFTHSLVGARSLLRYILHRFDYVSMFY